MSSRSERAQVLPKITVEAGREYLLEVTLNGAVVYKRILRADTMEVKVSEQGVESNVYFNLSPI